MRYLSTIIFGLLLSSAAFPDEHGIDFSTELVNANGEKYVACIEMSEDHKCTKTVHETLGFIAWAAMRQPVKGLGLDEQVQRGLLAIKVKDAKVLVLTATEIQMIENQLGTLNLDPIELVAALRVLDPAKLTGK